MELQVDIPSSPPHNFNFNNNNNNSWRSTTPCSPSTPKPFGGGSDLYFLSAPTSPNRAFNFYQEFEEFSNNNYYAASQPTSPAHRSIINAAEDDFSFQVNIGAADNPVSAHELFDGGRIRPSEPAEIHKTPSPKKKSSTTFWEALSPNKKGRRHSTSPFGLNSDQQQQVTTMMRGREKTISNSGSGRMRAARSLSPHHRESSSNYDYHTHQQIQKPNLNPLVTEPPQSSTRTTLGSLVLQTKTSRRWRLKDFLLFRSASEGRASDKDPLRKYSTLFYRKLDDKSSLSSSSNSFRSTTTDGSTSKRMVSAHEMHYTTNKAVSDHRKKKTFLPYKERILGRFPF